MLPSRADLRTVLFCAAAASSFCAAAQLSDMDAYFGGFFTAFNMNAPPPPSRTEFVAAAAECAECKLTAKCVAVLP